VRYFGTIDDMLWLARRGRLGRQASAEIMTHPRLGPNGTVLDAPSMEPLVERVRLLRPYMPVSNDGSSVLQVLGVLGILAVRGF
jgi:hypothetical protein